jgi:hypothetical protein
MNKFSVFCIFTHVDGSCCTFVVVSFNIGGLLCDFDVFPYGNEISNFSLYFLRRYSFILLI